MNKINGNEANAASVALYLLARGFFYTNLICEGCPPPLNFVLFL